MAMFGDGGGGNFDPGNWVDMQVFNDVTKNDNGGGSFHHNKNDDDNHHDIAEIFHFGLKITNIVAWVGFFLLIIIKVKISNQYKYPDKIPQSIESAFTIIPIIWLALTYIVGFIALVIVIKNKEKDKNDKNKKW